MPFKTKYKKYFNGKCHTIFIMERDLGKLNFAYHGYRS